MIKILSVKKRRRGTAIVDTYKGILVVSGKSKRFILPGGGANRGETRTIAAMRELKEETGLNPYYAKFLFRYVGRPHRSWKGGLFQDHHTVVLAKASGTPRPRKEVRHVRYYNCKSNFKISKSTKDIIERYYKYKKEDSKNADRD